MIAFTKKERLHLLISILSLGFIFGFNDNQDIFNLANWLINLLRAMISAALILLVYELCHKMAAKRYGAETSYEIWQIKRYGFFRTSKFPKKILGITIPSFPLGLILSVIATVISNGLFYIALIPSFSIIERPYLRLSAKFKHISNFEEAKIASFSIIALLLLALILNATSQNMLFNQLTLMIFVFIGYSLLPISTLDGSKIFFGSIPLYIGIVIFALVSYLLMNVFNIIFAIILALIAAIFLTILYIGLKK